MKISGTGVELGGHRSTCIISTGQHALIPNNFPPVWAGGTGWVAQMDRAVHTQDKMQVQFLPRPLKQPN